MDISVIIVNYNSKEKTLNCLRHIFNSNLEGLEVEVFVVENNSNDNLKEELKEKYPSVKYIDSPVNLGMGGGNNLGIKESTGKYILVLNPDAYVSEDSIRKMYDYLENNEDVGIVGPKLLNADKTLQYSCANFHKIYTPIIRRTCLSKVCKKHEDWFLMKKWSHDNLKEVDWLMGSCLLVRRKEWSFFDERFFMYFEDTDLCRRAWYNNYKVIYYPDTEVIHDHQRASANIVWYLALSSKITREHIKSWFRYFNKWIRIKDKK